MKRREFLRTAGGAAGATAAGGAASSSAAASGGPAALQQENESDPDQPGTGGEPSPGGQTESGDPSQEENPQGEEGEGEEASEDWGGTQTVMVGPDNELVFEPETLPITPGTTVRWEWDSDTHNVNPTSVPDDAEWEGHQPIENEGFTYEYTFDVEGTYEYVCQPHAPGMSGVIEVSEDAGGGHEEVDPAHMGVPLQKHFIGAGAFMGIFSTLVFIFYVLKYGESAHTSAPGMED